jgi:hypothetical protein
LFLQENSSRRFASIPAVESQVLTAVIFFFPHGSTAPFRVPRPPHFEASRSHIRHTTLGSTPLDEWPLLPYIP